GVEPGGIEAVAIVEGDDGSELRGLDPIDPRRRRLRRTPPPALRLQAARAPPAAFRVEAARDPIELGVVTGVERGRGALARRAVAAADVTARVETPDEQEDERDQEPGGILADAAFPLAPAPAGEEEAAPRPEVAQRLEDGRVVPLGAGPRRAGRCP